MADISGISGYDSSYAASSASGTSSTNEDSSTLGKDDFLKILITQLTNQDPLEPLEDTEFIAQMAQFTSLEQMTNMAQSLESLTNFSMLNAVGFIDRTVTYVNDEGGLSEATVTGVAFDNGAVVLTLDDESAIYLESVVGVA